MDYLLHKDVKEELDEVGKDISAQEVLTALARLAGLVARLDDMALSQSKRIVVLDEWRNPDLIFDCGGCGEQRRWPRVKSEFLCSCGWGFRLKS